MRIIITGSSGYIGHYLAMELGIQEHKILCIDKVNGDNINDLDTQFKMETFNPHLIYHLAGQTSVNKSFEDPIQDVKDNIITTLNVLKLGCRIIFTSTGAIYGDHSIYVNECDKIYPNSPYAENKSVAEYYIKNYGIPYTILRLGNVYGRNNNKGVIKALREGKPIFGDGTHTRDYIYIDDVIEALIQARYYPIGIYNIGTGIETSVNQIADLLKIKAIYAPEVKEQIHVSLDISKSIYNNWCPKRKLKEYINK